MDVLLYVVLALLVLAAAGWFATARVVKQVERGVVFRLGRVQDAPRPPGLTMLVPVVDRMKRVNM
jgi:regulator of protease activity HflC (stomatin/prohibitin superfamily)